MVSIGLGGNVLTAEITLVDGSDIAVGRMEVTGVAVANGTVTVWFDVGPVIAAGASAEVAGAVAARGTVAV